MGTDEKQEIERLRRDVSELKSEISELWDRYQTDRTNLFVELATLKAKSGIFGIIGGLLPGLAVLLLEYRAGN